MEAWQKDQIKINLPDLQQLTTVNESLLAELQKADIFGPADVDALKPARKNGELVASDLLYVMVQSRTDGYRKLTKALKAIGQNGAYNILRNGYKQELLEIVRSKIRSFELTDLEKILETGSYDQDFDEIFIEETRTFQIVQNTVPDTPSIYIPRFISNQITLSSEIFKTKCSDVFVLNGIERSQLSALAGLDERTSTSGQQICRLTSRFILLEDTKDWPELKKLAKGPIHLISVNSYSDKNSPEYFLEETKGHSEILWEYSQKQTDLQNRVYISEADFVEKLLSEEEVRVCICDNPGTGKSCILASLAHQFQTRVPDAFVAFIPMSIFIKDVLIPNASKRMDSSIALNCVLEFICPSSLSKAIVSYGFEKKLIPSIYIFFDGFDEVPTNQVKLTCDFLENLGENGESLKVFVASRPNLQQLLEDKLDVIAYDILPFSEQTQIEFLVNIWKRKHPHTCLEKLSKFARYALHHFETEFCNKEKDFLGKPLMCHLISELLSREAGFYGKPGTKTEFNQKMLSNVNTVFKLYENLLENLNADKAKSKQIKRFHVWKAFAVLFPEISDQMKAYLKCNMKPEVALQSNHCILQMQRNSNSETVNFVHLTFAEFLVAEFLGTFFVQRRSKEHLHKTLKNLLNIETDHSMNKTVLKFLDEKLFKVTKVNKIKLFSSKYDCKFYSFNYPVILNFLNSYLDTYGFCELNTFKEPVPRVMKRTELEIMCYTFQSCIAYGFVNIFRLLKSRLNISLPDAKSWLESASLPVVFDSYCGKPHTSSVECFVLLLQVAAKFANREMMEQCIGLFTDSFGLKLEIIWDKISKRSWTPLSTAVQMANYELTEYLVFRLPLEKSSYLHIAVRHSNGDPTQVVKTRQEICNLLLSREPSLLSELSGHKSTPALLEDNVHLNLIKFLVQKGANIQAIRYEDEFTLVHTASTYMNRNDFHELCRFLIEDCQSGKDLFKKHIHNRRHPVLNIVRTFKNLQAKTLKMILQQCEININIKYSTKNSAWWHKDMSASTLLHAALEADQSTELIEYLVNQGADVNVIDKNKRNSLHFAVVGSKVHKVAYLLSLGVLSDLKDNKSNHCLVLAAQYGRWAQFKLLIWNSANIFTENVGWDTIGHVALKNKFPVGILKLVTYVWKQSRDDTRTIISKKNNEGKNLIDLTYKSESDIFKIISGEVKPSLELSGSTVQYAIRLRRLVCLLDVLSSCGVNFKVSDKSGKYPIQTAADEKYWSAVAYIFLLDTEISYLETEAKEMLHKACINLFPELIGLDGKLGESSNYSRLLKDFLFKLTTCKSKHSPRNTYFHMAAIFYDTRSYHKLVTTVLENGYKDVFKITNDQGQTPLHLAIFNTNLKPETLNVLFSSEHNNFNVNNVDKDGHSILHYALFAKRDLSFIKQLVQFRANTNLLDKEDRTVADICSQLGLTEHKNYFIELGCTENHKNSNLSKNKLFMKIGRLFEIYDNDEWFP